MKRPEAQLTWRGIEFEWVQSANAYIADTAHGRWTIQRHANDSQHWFARFGQYAGNWADSPAFALTSVLLVAASAHRRALEYLGSLP